ncbi:hypothetical protein PsorP6_001430 [Peronosclerospora sorghi]|uniref:Uncharacterized protein n=1 Tax=Peronosclerospora sorghi TaxID=230839 RepID=A0ACC0WUK1_9STRA|nr:hypothetical protein PsorP6_001430 [Peronosclerospora sorghi]
MLHVPIDDSPFLFHWSLWLPFTVNTNKQVPNHHSFPAIVFTIARTFSFVRTDVKYTYHFDLNSIPPKFSSSKELVEKMQSSVQIGASPLNYMSFMHR